MHSHATLYFVNTLPPKHFLFPHVVRLGSLPAASAWVEKLSYKGESDDPITYCLHGTSQFCNVDIVTVVYVGLLSFRFFVKYFIGLLVTIYIAGIVIIDFFAFYEKLHARAC